MTLIVYFFVVTDINSAELSITNQAARRGGTHQSSGDLTASLASNSCSSPMRCNTAAVLCVQTMCVRGDDECSGIRDLIGCGLVGWLVGWLVD